MLSKSVRCMENYSAANTGQQKGPNSVGQYLTACRTTNASEAEWIGLRSFASSPIFLWPLANQLLLLQGSQQFFAEKMLPQPTGGRKCFPRVCQILKHIFLLYKNKQTYFLLANMLIVMVPIFIYKDVFEPSYVLKFMVQKHNYVCTNLIKC